MAKKNLLVEAAKAVVGLDQQHPRRRATDAPVAKDQKGRKS